MSIYLNIHTSGCPFYPIGRFILLWVFLFTSYSSYGQVLAEDEMEYRLWYSGFDARSSAMANANVADPFDLNGLHTNPAIPVFSSNSPALISNSLYNPDRAVVLENITVSLNRHTSHRLTGSATVQSSRLSENLVSTPGQMQFTQVDLTLGYSWLLFQTLSAGLAVHSLYGKTATSEVLTHNASFGFLYEPSSLVSYGLVYRGTGIAENRLGAEPVYELTEESETIVTGIQAPHRLELGLTLRFPSLVRYPDFILSLSNEKIFGVDGLIYRGGLEVNVQNFLALRGGYFFSPFAEGSRLGLGFLLDAFRLDYAFAPTSIDMTGKSHQISISLGF